MIARHFKSVSKLKFDAKARLSERATFCLTAQAITLSVTRLITRLISIISTIPTVCSGMLLNISRPLFCFLGSCLFFVLLSLTPNKVFAHGEIVVVQIDKYEFELELNNIKAAETLRRSLPLQIEMTRWGDQFNGRSPIWIEAEIGAQTEMEIGDVAFWSPGECICVFFGPTPHSPGLTPKLSSPGMVLGKLKGNVAVLRNLGGTASMFIKEK